MLIYFKKDELFVCLLEIFLFYFYFIVVKKERIYFKLRGWCFNIWICGIDENIINYLIMEEVEFKCVYMYLINMIFDFREGIIEECNVFFR